MCAAHIPQRLPEGLTPQEIGGEFAKLRTQFGLSPQEVSERLHIRARYITAMEEGRYEAMPGTVYARGYIHTYAEFLGLDPEYTVQQCYASPLKVVDSAVSNSEPAKVSTKAPKAPKVAPTRVTEPSSNMGWMRGLLLIAVIAAVAYVMRPKAEVTEDTAVESSSVAPVPDEFLDAVRTKMMPPAGSFDCLMHDSWFACTINDEASRMLTFYDTHELFVRGDIDLSEPVATIEDDSAKKNEESVKTDDAEKAND